eukprot:3883532-Amphidinium_carterae.1
MRLEALTAHLAELCRFRSDVRHGPERARHVGAGTFPEACCILQHEMLLSYHRPTEKTIAFLMLSLWSGLPLSHLVSQQVKRQCLAYVARGLQQT